MTILKIFFRYTFLFILINEATPSQGQFVDSFSLAKSTGCYPYALLGTAWNNSPSPITQSIWYVTTCGGTLVFTTPAGVNNTLAYAPQSSGCYCIRLWMKNQNGDTSSFVKCNIIEDDTAIINATLLSLPQFCINNTATLGLNNSTDCGTIDTTQVFWSCGTDTVVAGNPSSISHFFGGSCIPGCYDITVLVKNTCGCYSSKAYPAMLCAIPPPIANFSADTTFAVCVGSLTTHFTADSADPNITYCWYVNGVQQQCSTSRSFTYTFPTSPTCYDIKLSVTHPSGCSDSLDRPGYICVQSTPVLTFSENKTSVCLEVGETTQLCLTNTTQGLNNPTWMISPGGITGQGNTFCDTLSNPGAYSVTMIGTFAPGCTNSIVQANAFTINPTPVPCYTTSDTFSCTIPYCVTLTNCSTPPGCTYSWNFGVGGSNNGSAVANPTTCYNSYGRRYITLYATSPKGCTAQFNLPQPLIIDTLVPSFVINHSKGCSPLTTTIVNGTSISGYPDPVQSYTWSFPGSNPAIPDQTGPSITQSFNQPGCYNVQLQLKTASGCVSTTRLNDTICTGTPPTCTLTATPLTKCYDSLPVYFILNCDSFGTAVAFFGNGEGAPAVFSHSDTITHIYQSYGTFNAWIITMNDSCPSDTLHAQITIYPPIANFNDSSSCLTGDSVYLLNQSERATRYSWQFSCLPGPDTAANPILLMPNCVSCYVQLTAYNDSFNCQNTKRDSITTSCNGPPSFTPLNISGCAPFKPTFTNTTPGANRGTTYWNFDINNNSPLCPAIPGCVTGTTIVSPIRFGPGISEMAMVYKAPGGCIDTLYGFVHACNLTAGFSPTGICLPDSFHFQGFATDSFCDGKFKWSWNFGSGVNDTSSQPDPVYYYNTPGQYPVSLTVSDSTGCSVSITQTVTIGTAVYTSWSFDSTICQDLQVCITNNTTSPVPMTETWYFPGSAIDSFVGHSPPCVTYPTQGYFPIIYNVIAGTCDKTDTQYVDVHTPILSAIISSNYTACPNPPLIVSVINTSQYVDLATDLVTWTFYNIENNTIWDQSHQWEPTEVFTFPGMYVDSLCVLTNNGCLVCSIIDTITVEGPYGTLSYSSNDACTCKDSITYTVSTIKSSNVVFIYGCNQGFQIDSINPIGTPQNPSFVTFKAAYCVSDTCQPQLIFGDTAGCTVLLQEQPIYIDSPMVNFTYSNKKICNSGTVTFFDSTYYTLPHDTSYTVNWAWNFGDGSSTATSSLQNPSHFYSQPGTYQIQLIVTSNYGCRDSITKQIIIYPRPVAAFSLSDSVICSNQAVCLTDQSTGIVPISTWQWDYGDNFDTTTPFPPCHTYSPPFLQFYNLQLAVTDTNGCTDTASRLLKVNVSPTADFTWLPTCEDSFMVLNDISTSGSNILNFCQWTLWLGAPNPVTDNNCNTTFQFPAGFYPVQFVVGDANGCFDTIVKTVESDALTQLSVNPGDTVVCLGSSVTYNLNGVYTKINWLPNIWINRIDSAEAVITPLGNVGYVVTAQSGVCTPVSDAFSIDVIQPLPPIEVTAAPPRIFLGLSSDIISQIQRQDSVVQIDSIIWNPDSTLSCNNCMNPIATPTQTTTYTVTVYYSQNGYTCTSSAEVTIEVIYSCDSAIIFIPNTFTPNGDGKNDIFMIRGMGGTTIKYFRIFDRWGNLLFEAQNAQLNDAEYGWNGNDMNGKKLNDGVYVYEYEIECMNRETIIGQGNVTLVR